MCSRHLPLLPRHCKNTQLFRDATQVSVLMNVTANWVFYLDVEWQLAWLARAPPGNGRRFKGRGTSSGNSDRSRCHRSRFAIAIRDRKFHSIQSHPKWKFSADPIGISIWNFNRSILPDKSDLVVSAHMSKAPLCVWGWVDKYPDPKFDTGNRCPSCKLAENLFAQWAHDYV